MVAPAGDRMREVRNVTLVGAVVDFVLGGLKLTVGFAANSQSLIADGVHSLSDLATDAVVLFAAREAQREADEEHPYGHARIETMATVALGVSLIAVGVGIGIDAIGRMFEPEHLLHPTALALVAAAISVVLKELVYHYTLRAARRLRSELLRANAWHSRTDAISSLFVIVGVGGALAGLPYVDAVAAVAVAGMIAHIGGRLAWSNVRELIDTGLDRGQLSVIEHAILSVDGVRAIHMLRTRRMAGQALVEVHILLNDPRISVSEGHQVSETVRSVLLDQVDDISDVTVHIDPEDDEESPPNDDLPLRAEATRRLREHWASVPVAAEIADVRLHYLSGRIFPEVVIARSVSEEPKAIRRSLNDALRTDPDFGEVTVLFE